MNLILHDYLTSHKYPWEEDGSDTEQWILFYDRHLSILNRIWWKHPLQKSRRQSRTSLGHKWGWKDLKFCEEVIFGQQENKRKCVWKNSSLLLFVLRLWIPLSIVSSGYERIFVTSPTVRRYNANHKKVMNFLLCLVSVQKT